MSMEGELPSFGRPPVVEVVQGVQFARLALTPVHYGMLFQRLRSHFPRQQMVPPLPPMVERFDVSPGGQQSGAISLAFEEPAELPRLWFISADDLSLIQIQHDRLLFNWRLRPQMPDYPRYNYVRAGFISAYGYLRDVICSEGLGDLTVTGCELTYINHIIPPSGVTVANPERVFRWWSDSSDAGIGKQEDVWFNVRRRLVNERGDTWGRLYVKVMPSLRSDRQSFYATEITARGPSLEAGLCGALKFHDLAHVAIVQTFALMTTDEMHELWGRTR